MLIFQRVAGSGKTSITLHRSAFLLYRFKDTLSSDDILIISPNRVFADYIGNVLPDLAKSRSGNRPATPRRRSVARQVRFEAQASQGWRKAACWSRLRFLLYPGITAVAGFFIGEASMEFVAATSEQL